MKRFPPTILVFGVLVTLRTISAGKTVPEYAAPEAVASAFVDAYSGTDVDALGSLYADRVDHTNSGVISNAAVRAQAREYFARWPVRQWKLLGPVTTTSLGANRQKVVFEASYDASNPRTNQHASGVAEETLILSPDKTGAMKIVSQKEQTSKRRSIRSADETSGPAALKAAKAEYEASPRDEAARVRYVTRLAAMLGEGMDYWWRTHDKMGGPDLDGVTEELVKHPIPGNTDSTKLSQLLVGKWLSPRHVYEFRANGTYGMEDTEQRDKWRIAGNEYIDDVSRGRIILIDDKYFVYTQGAGVVFYLRVKDSEVKANASDSAIGQKLVGYWKLPKAVCYITARGQMHVGPRKNETEKSHWSVKNGIFYWDNVAYTIVTLTDNTFVFREMGAGKATFTLIRSSKEEVDPDSKLD